MRALLSPRGRLVGLALFLLLCFAIFGLWRPVGVDQLRAGAGATGALAPLVYVLVSAALACVLVPGALLAAGAGLLFGPLPGGAVAIVSATLAAVLGLTIGRSIGAQGLRDLVGARMETIDPILARHGVWAVVIQRLMPGVPDSPSSYAFGAAGVRVRQVAAGTLIGSLPRAFAYAALGSAAVTFDPLVAGIGVGVLIAAGVLGSLLAARVARRARPRPSGEE